MMRAVFNPENTDSAYSESVSWAELFRKGGWNIRPERNSSRRTNGQSSTDVVMWLVSDVVEKNIDSSSKSNPLRRRGKNYDASTWRRRRRRQKNEESRRTFNKYSCDSLTAI